LYGYKKVLIGAGREKMESDRDGKRKRGIISVSIRRIKDYPGNE